VLFFFFFNDPNLISFALFFIVVLLLSLFHNNKKLKNKSKSLKMSQIQPPNVICYYSIFLIKIINRLKIKNDNLKFNDDFKSYITVRRTL
jgi:hypothetical protein